MEKDLKSQYLSLEKKFTNESGSLKRIKKLKVSYKWFIFFIAGQIIYSIVMTVFQFELFT